METEMSTDPKVAELRDSDVDYGYLYHERPHLILHTSPHHTTCLHSRHPSHPPVFHQYMTCSFVHCILFHWRLSKSQDRTYC